jgi:hypothetical protein
MRKALAGFCASFCAGDCWRSGVRALKPGLTFGSFGYKGTGFASFASKRSLKYIFTDSCRQFYTLNSIM